MTYTPHRDLRFDHVSDIYNFMEETQCKDCIFRKMDTQEEMMCEEFEVRVLLEMEIEHWDDLGDQGLKCNVRAVV